MIDIKRLTADYSVSRQPAAEDFAMLRAQGFRSVINNRLAGEAEAPYPSVDEEKGLTEGQGMTYAHLPVRGAEITDPDTIAAFADLLDKLPKPILAHCGGGTRSAVLWALASAARMPLQDIMDTTANAGFDLARYRDALAARAADSED